MADGTIGRRALAAAIWVIATTPAAATCFDAAALRYNIPSELLRAISEVESAGRWTAVNRNPDGSEDVCAMQINSFWFSRLSRLGIEREHLLAEPCTCVMSGAWILAQEIEASGYSWETVGQYHAGRSGPAVRKEAYARRVSRALASAPTDAEPPPQNGEAPLPIAEPHRQAVTISRSDEGGPGRRPSRFFVRIEP